MLKRKVSISWLALMRTRFTLMRMVLWAASSQGMLESLRTVHKKILLRLAYRLKPNKLSLLRVLEVV